VHEFPIYSLDIIEKNISSDGGQQPVQVKVEICAALEQNLASGTTKAKKLKNRGSNMTAILTLDSDNKFLDFRRIP
jgi:ATP-dependent DNA helicase HFM1/MER3